MSQVLQTFRAGHRGQRHGENADSP